MRARYSYGEGLEALAALHHAGGANPGQETFSAARAEEDYTVPSRQEVTRFGRRLLVVIAAGYATLQGVEMGVEAVARPVVATVRSAVDRMNGIECKGETDPYTTRHGDTFDGLAQKLDPEAVLNLEELSGIVQRRSGWEGPAHELPAGLSIRLVRPGDCSQ